MFPRNPAIREIVAESIGSDANRRGIIRESESEVN